VKKVQILDMDALAVSTKDFSVFAGDPQPGSGQVQIPNLAPGPAVNTGSPFAASMAYGLKPIVGLHMDVSCCGFGCDRLIYNFYSTKGEIWCYTDSGHRRPPLDIVFLGR
jgi:hypothetical protein